LGLWTLSSFGILNTGKHMHLDPLIEVSSFSGTQQSRCLSSHLKTETDPVSYMLCFLVFRILDDGLIVTHHRQDPLQSIRKMDFYFGALKNLSTGFETKRVK
jgi:hypothetical protein